METTGDEDGDTRLAAVHLLQGVLDDDVIPLQGQIVELVHRSQMLIDGLEAAFQGIGNIVAFDGAGEKFRKPRCRKILGVRPVMGQFFARHP